MIVKKPAAVTREQVVALELILLTAEMARRTAEVVNHISILGDDVVDDFHVRGGGEILSFEVESVVEHFLESIGLQADLSGTGGAAVDKLFGYTDVKYEKDPEDWEEPDHVIRTEYGHSPFTDEISKKIDVRLSYLMGEEKDGLEPPPIEIDLKKLGLTIMKVVRKDS